MNYLILVIIFKDQSKRKIDPECEGEEEKCF